jgi:spermidine synthase
VTNYLIVAFTSSFCSMSFSMIMALLMGEFTGEEVLTQCLTLGPYLLGLGLGSASGDRIREELRLPRLFLIEWLSVLILPLIPLLQLVMIFLFINLAPTLFNFDSPESVKLLLSMTAVLSFITGLLGGAQLPLILKSGKSLRPEIILAVNYLGPLFAGLTIAFLSSRALSFGVQIYFIGLIQLMGLFFLLFKLPERTKALVSLAIPLAILFTAGSVYPVLENYTVKSGYMNTRLNGLDPRPLLRVLDRYGILQRLRTTYQTIDLFMEPGEPAFGVPGNATLYLNRKPQFDLYSVDVYHETMIDGAFNLLGKTPERILILGAGDGLLLNELRGYPEVKEIIMVELDEKMLEWASQNTIISNLNEGSLTNVPPNARVLVQDGISYLRNTGQKFDLVLVDFPFPNSQELAKLYSVEFYELVKKSLTSGGLTVIDLPLYLDDSGELANESRTILKTMDRAGFRNRLLMGPNASFVALKAGGKKLEFNYDTLRSDLTLSAAFNLVAPFSAREFSKKDKVNTMFWPRGL